MLQQHKQQLAARQAALKHQQLNFWQNASELLPAQT
jgi:hypothetical protein